MASTSQTSCVATQYQSACGVDMSHDLFSSEDPDFMQKIDDYRQNLNLKIKEEEKFLTGLIFEVKKKETEMFNLLQDSERIEDMIEKIKTDLNKSRTLKLKIEEQNLENQKLDEKVKEAKLKYDDTIEIGKSVFADELSCSE